MKQEEERVNETGEETVNETGEECKNRKQKGKGGQKL